MGANKKVIEEVWTGQVNATNALNDFQKSMTSALATLKIEVVTVVQDVVMQRSTAQLCDTPRPPLKTLHNSLGLGAQAGALPRHVSSSMGSRAIRIRKWEFVQDQPSHTPLSGHDWNTIEHR